MGIFDKKQTPPAMTDETALALELMRRERDLVSVLLATTARYKEALRNMINAIDGAYAPKAVDDCLGELQGSREAFVNANNALAQFSQQQGR